jgi:hypothetical protein
MFAHWFTVLSMIDDTHLLLDFHFLKYYYECNLICRLACLLNLDFIPVYFNLRHVPEHTRGVTYKKPCLDISDVISTHCLLFHFVLFALSPSNCRAEREIDLDFLYCSAVEHTARRARSSHRRRIKHVIIDSSLCLQFVGWRRWRWWWSSHFCVLD